MHIYNIGDVVSLSDDNNEVLWITGLLNNIRESYIGYIYYIREKRVVYSYGVVIDMHIKNLVYRYNQDEPYVNKNNIINAINNHNNIESARAEYFEFQPELIPLPA
jgi:hypothetical protein